MIVHRGARVVYLAHPRTASVATERALLRGAGWEEVCPEMGRHATMDRWPWWARQSDEERERWEVLTTVRNHFDALVSWSFLRIFDLPRLGADYVRAIIQNSPTYFVAPGRMWGLHSDVATRLLRYESLQSDLDAALAGRGLPAVQLEPENVSQARERRPYQEFYDAGSRDLAATVFGDEMRTMNYGWET